MKPVEGVQILQPAVGKYYLVMVRFWWNRQGQPAGVLEVREFTWQEFGLANTGWVADRVVAYVAEPDYTHSSNLNRIRSFMNRPDRFYQLPSREIIEQCVALYVQTADEFTQKLREEGLID